MAGTVKTHILRIYMRFDGNLPATLLPSDVKLDAMNQSRQPTEYFFTEDQYLQLMQLACSAGPVTKEQIFWFVKQCEKLKAQALLLELILQNKVVISHITEHEFSIKLA